MRHLRPGVPRLPASAEDYLRPAAVKAVDNVTVSEALDHIAKTFGGIWVYESCAKTEKRNAMVYIRFYYLRKIDFDDVVLE